LLFDALNSVNVAPKKAKICILGYAFLENSDDTRNTPTKPLYKSLVKKCADIVVHDPYVTEEEDIPITADLEKALKGKDAVVLVTKHNEYREIDLAKLKKGLRTPIIIDGRNMFDPKLIKKMGFVFRGVGKGKDNKN
jgi:UDP-N-acetyl-D-mannosaminuronic acid dehydrogenase